MQDFFKGRRNQRNTTVQGLYHTCRNVLNSGAEYSDILHKLYKFRFDYLTRWAKLTSQSHHDEAVLVLLEATCIHVHIHLDTIITSIHIIDSGERANLVYI